MRYVNSLARIPAHGYATGVALGLPTAQAAVARQHRLLPRHLATWNPRGCLVAVLEEHAQAARAALALREADFGEADVCLVAPRHLTPLLETRGRRGRLARFVDALRAPGDEGLVVAEYLAAARRGHHLLIVHAPGDARLGRARGVLVGHGAHTLHYFGRWIVRGM